MQPPQLSMSRSRHALVAAALAATSFVGVAERVGASGPAPLHIGGFDDIVLDEEFGRLFISEGLGGSVAVIDLSGVPLGTLATPDPRHLALSHDGTTLWVTQPLTNELVGFDTATLAETARFSLPADVCPGSVADVAGTYLAVGHSCNRWAGSGGYGGVGVLDTSSGAFSDLLSGGPFYQPIVASSAGAADLFVTGDLGLSPTTLSTVTSIGGEPDLVAERYNTGSNLRDLAVAPDGSTVVQASGFPYDHNSYTIPFLADSVVYDSTNYPNAVAWSADGTTVVSGTDSSYDDDVRFHDAAGGGVTAVFELGARLVPGGLAVSGDGRTGFAITETGSANAYSLQILSATVLATSLTLAGPSSAEVGTSFELTGALIDELGDPVAGAEISFFSDAAPTASLGSTTTTPNGSFRFFYPPPTAGTYTIDAHFFGAEGLAPSSASVTVDVVRAVPELSISATAVGKGKDKGKYDVIAAFTDDGPARLIELYELPEGGAEAYLADGQTISVQVEPVVTTTYIARFAGDARYEPTEAHVTIEVRKGKGGGKPNR